MSPVARSAKGALGITRPVPRICSRSELLFARCRGRKRENESVNAKSRNSFAPPLIRISSNSKPLTGSDLLNENPSMIASKLDLRTLSSNNNYV